MAEERGVGIGMLTLELWKVGNDVRTKTSGTWAISTSLQLLTDLAYQFSMIPVLNNFLVFLSICNKPWQRSSELSLSYSHSLFAYNKRFDNLCLNRTS